MNLVLSTCSAPEARAIAQQLVIDRYAACCNLLPQVESVYWWEGQVTTDQEVLMIFKVPSQGVSALMARLKEIHPYQVPEMLSIEVASGFEPYLAWVSRETRTHRS